MILRIPDYYKEFSCIGGACKHSCCLGWEIDIDEETWDYYRSIEGPFGDRLRANMVSMEENSFRLREENRCPFLNKDNLCDIIIELGETSLCAICTEYPRQTLEYGEVRERCLSISCEEVGRIVFSRKEPIGTEEQLLDLEYVICEEDKDEICPESERGEHLRLVRDHAIRILQRRQFPIEYRILRYLRFAAEVQDYINQDLWAEMDELPARELAWESIEEEAAKVEAEDMFAARRLSLQNLEILDEEWAGVFEELCHCYEEMEHEERRRLVEAFMREYRSREYEYEHLLVYYTFRYCLKSVFDYQFLAKAQLAVLGWLTIRDLDALHYRKTGTFTLQDRIDLARIYSREVEHSEDNLEYLADDFVFEEDLRWEALCQQVMFGY